MVGGKIKLEQWLRLLVVYKDDHITPTVISKDGEKTNTKLIKVTIPTHLPLDITFLVCSDLPVIASDIVYKSGISSYLVRLLPDLPPKRESGYALFSGVTALLTGVAVEA